MEEIHKEIQDLWREMVSEMNCALSDKCIRELQAQGELETRYLKFRQSLQGTISDIKEFTNIKSVVQTEDIPPNPFDVENLPQVPLAKSQQSVQKSVPAVQEVKGPSPSTPSCKELDQAMGSTSFVQKNGSLQSPDICSNFSYDSRCNNGYQSSLGSRSESFQNSTNSRSIASDEAVDFRKKPYRYGYTGDPDFLSRMAQNLESVREMHNDQNRSCRSRSVASSLASVHTLTAASLSPAAEPEESKLSNSDLRLRNSRSDSFQASTLPREPVQESHTDESDKRCNCGSDGRAGRTLIRSQQSSGYEGRPCSRRLGTGSLVEASFSPSGFSNCSVNNEKCWGFTNEPSNSNDTNRQTNGFGKCENSDFSNVASGTAAAPSKKEKNGTKYPVENVKMFGSFEQCRQEKIVLPSPDLTYASSEEEDELELKESKNTMSSRRWGDGSRAFMPDPSSIFAKKGDLVPHKTPPFKQLVNVKVTWIASQRDFYVVFVNEESKYLSLARDIARERYESLIGRKVEEGDPCMVRKDGQFYRALLETSGLKMCRVFLVDFGGFLMLSRGEVTPMLRYHAELPMAALHCGILAAFRAELTANCIERFKAAFPIDSNFKLLFIRQSRHGGIYEAQLYLQDNMRHDAFLPWEALY